MIDEIIDKFMFSIYGGIFFLLLSCIAFYNAIVMENKKYHARTWPFVNLLFIGLGFLALGIIILVKYA
jgi:hypothetical protein